jgi:tetratricopeptide (TPR) repeat protein
MEQMQTHIERFPREVRPRTFLANLHHTLGNSARAADVLEKALELSPRKIHIMRNLGLYYLESEQFDKAMETFKRARKLTPPDSQYRILHAMAARYAGDEEQVTAILEPLSKETWLFSDYLMRPYLDAGNLRKAASLQEDRVTFLEKQMDQSDEREGDTLQRYIQARATLASLYARIGQARRADAVLDAIIREHPAMEDQVEQLRDQIDNL